MRSASACQCGRPTARGRAQRGDRPACVSASASGGSGIVPSASRMPPPYAARRVGRVAPALLRRGRRTRGGPVPDQPVAALECALKPRAAARHARSQLLGQRIVAERVEHHQEPRGPVGGAVIAQLAVSTGQPMSSKRSGAAAGTRARSCRAPRRCRRRRRVPCSAASARSVARATRAAREAPEAR